MGHPPDALAPPVDAIEAAKLRSTAQLLFRCARMVNELGVARVRAETGRALRPSHTAVFPHLDLAGTRLTEIARRMGISKQAVGQLVDQLEEMGAVERVPDPTDGRARLVRFASRPGEEHPILAGLSVLGALEAELAAEIGAERWAALHDALSALNPVVEARVAALEAEPG